MHTILYCIKDVTYPRVSFYHRRDPASWSSKYQGLNAKEMPLTSKCLTFTGLFLKKKNPITLSNLLRALNVNTMVSFSVYLYSCSNNIHGVGDGGGGCCCHWSCQSLQNQMGTLTWCQQGQLLCERKGYKNSVRQIYLI